MTARSPQAVAALGFLLALALPAAEPASTAAPLKPLPPYVPGFPVLFPVDFVPSPEGALIAADLDGDGKQELIASTRAGVVAAGEGGMRPGWPRRFDDLPQPTYPGIPGAGDLDGDGRDEVVICVNAGSYLSRSIHLYAFRGDGTDVPGWPIVIPSTIFWSECFPESATLVTDLDGDGRAEVVVATAEVWAFDGAGQLLPGWPFRPDLGGFNPQLTAADMDGDGFPEVVGTRGGLHDQSLMVIDVRGQLLPLYSTPVPDMVSYHAPPR